MLVGCCLLFVVCSCVVVLLRCVLFVVRSLRVALVFGVCLLGSSSLCCCLRCGCVVVLLRCVVLLLFVVPWLLRVGCCFGVFVGSCLLFLVCGDVSVLLRWCVGAYCMLLVV